MYCSLGLISFDEKRKDNVRKDDVFGYYCGDRFCRVIGIYTGGVDVGAIGLHIVTNSSHLSSHVINVLNVPLHNLVANFQISQVIRMLNLI
jgi:hypothetical protein